MMIYDEHTQRAMNIIGDDVARLTLNTNSAIDRITQAKQRLALACVSLYGAGEWPQEKVREYDNLSADIRALRTFAARMGLS